MSGSNKWQWVQISRRQFDAKAYNLREKGWVFSKYSTLYAIATSGRFDFVVKEHGGGLEVRIDTSKASNFRPSKQQALMDILRDDGLDSITISRADDSKTDNPERFKEHLLIAISSIYLNSGDSLDLTRYSDT